MELSTLQENIINAPSNKTVVLSSAASGKTHLLTQKVRQILRAGVDARTIAVITFTNMAAAELKKRLGADYKDGLFIGTIHALANYMLSSSGISTSKILEDSDFDKLFEMVKSHPQCIKHLDWILLDEAQDSDELQFNFLFEMIKPEFFFVCGDPKQSIYQWKGSNPRLLIQLSKQPGVQTFDMNENYRNGRNILQYAKRLIAPTGLYDTSIAMRNCNGTIAEVYYDLDLIAEKVSQDTNYSNWAILARTNQEIQTISYFLKKKGIPTDTFRQGDLSKEELTEKLKDNTVKILTVHSAKGLEWPNVIVTGMRYQPAEERNVCYVAATRAKDNLIWVNRPRKKKIKTYQW